MAQVTNETANPMGLNGVDFVEYAGAEASHFEKLFLGYGFKKVGEIPGKKISLYRQGRVNFIINAEPGTFAAAFAQAHGPSICSTGFIVKDAQKAYDLAVQRGAKPYKGSDTDKGATPFLAVYGIGDSLVYFMDESASKKLYNDIFKVKPEDAAPVGLGFSIVDHFTNNVPKGEMDKWADFYTNVFDFRETKYFDIRGKQTGLLSKVMRSPCGLFAVPINEPSDDKSQIQEYLDEYKGSGIQHVALLTDNIIKTLESLRMNKLDFLASPPSTYYRQLKERLPAVSEDLGHLEKNAILVDGDHDGYLLQIFSKNIIGPIFFEVIQRKGHDGFGNGNFQALFDAIEADQRERGYLK
ncbi:MAG: 4-hydroxyphenylpyruvate dioxygenase [Bdellovibrionaceae bacterium]|nr:4-hydroxyphenylpyruvate dioxygenase [Pseudobdellovibrionaceae bacterium]